MSNIITPEGLEKLKRELDELKNVKLKEVAVRIKDAKDLGDLSENAEYHEAKNEQAFLYGKALDIEQKIKNATVISKPKGESLTVCAGCKVIVNSSGDKMEFEIVGSDESDPVNGRISIDSPIGSALFGHKKGDTVSVLAPVGETNYKILSIE
ncbi:MAG: transcription elongation factor GreA [Patescibacteria group bacterium]|nr:transcription elongation factor GreA [Patescibacteria group bacterium]